MILYVLPQAPCASLLLCCQFAVLCCSASTVSCLFSCKVSVLCLLLCIVHVLNLIHCIFCILSLVNSTISDCLSLPFSCGWTVFFWWLTDLPCLFVCVCAYLIYIYLLHYIDQFDGGWGRVGSHGRGRPYICLFYNGSLLQMKHRQSDNKVVLLCPHCRPFSWQTFWYVLEGQAQVLVTATV